MIKRINQYLLTHHPLTWNTRIVWVLGVNLLLHLLFFLSGLGSIRAGDVHRYNDIWEVGGTGMFTLSILCSLLVITIWLVFYLRNNAFKQWYAISKSYLPREYGMIFLILLSSITFFESYKYGVKLRVRNFTSMQAFVQEVNTVNRAGAFIPTNQDAYFILNSCSEQEKHKRFFNSVSINDTAREVYPDSIRILIKAALERPDAFSYRHHCTNWLNYYNGMEGINSEKETSAANRASIDRGSVQEIEALVKQFQQLCQKYKVENRLDAGELAARVFASPYNKLGELVPMEEYSYVKGERTQNQYYIDASSVNSVYSFIEDCLPTPGNTEEMLQAFLVECYVALGLSILLLCYRRFSRKVFLISVIGTFVWGLLVGLFTAFTRGSGSATSFLVLALCSVFLAAALANLRGRSMKTATGVLLNWHIYLVPYFILLVAAMLNDQYSELESLNSKPDLDMTRWMAEHHPFLYWVNTHGWEIAVINFILVAFYVTIVFNNLAKKWHEMAEE